LSGIVEFFQLVVLFAVIFDPPASFMVFVSALPHATNREKKLIAAYAVSLAFSLSFLVLLFGERLLYLFSTSIDEFRIAGGIILGILGIRMVLGSPLMNLDKEKKTSGNAVAAIIATPLLTGPAAITTIIIASGDFGILLTGLAVFTVLALTGAMFYFSSFFEKVLSRTAVQIISTILGLITISWGVSMITTGIKAIFFL